MTDKIKEADFYHTRIKYWPENERPREKLLQAGASRLSDAELIAILVHSGTGKVTAVDLAKSLLVQFKNLYELSGRSIGGFIRLKGIGKAKAVTLIAAFEIGRRIASGNRPDKLKVYSPESVAKQEEFSVILLDTANNIIGEHVISRGSFNASVAHPREVFKKAITDSAACVILIHNHPSGNPEPSSDDKNVTGILVKAGEIIGIHVVDHIIIAGRRYCSFADHDLL